MRNASKTLITGAFLVLCGGPILAQTTYTWTGAATSAWNNNANWTPATGFPLAADHAIITGVGNSPVLDANRTVTNLTVSSGALNLAGFNLTATGTGNYSGGSLSTGGLVLNASANVVTFSGTVFNSQVSGSGADIRLSGSTFNQPVNLVMTGAASSTSQGGNTFNAPVQLAINNTGNLVLTNTNNDAFNGDLQLSSTGAGTIRFGSSVGVATLAAGRTISTGAGGFSIGTLNLGGFVQLGTTAQTLTLTGTAVLNMNPGTIFNADLNVTAPRLYLNGGTYQGNTRFTMTGALNAGGAGGCVFNGVLDLTVTGAGELYLYGTNNDLFNNNVRLNSVGGAGIRLGIGTGTGTLASGRTLTVGAAGFNSGYLYLGNLIQLGSTPQTIITTGTSQFFTFPGSIFNADLDVTAPSIFLSGGTFQGNTRFTMTGGAPAGGGGGCVFNGPLELTTTGAGMIFLHNVNNDLFNNNVRMNTTGGGGIRFGNGPGTGTLAAGRTMAVGAAGFNSGSLIIGNFTQLGSTAQNISITGTSTLYFYAGTTFNANLTTSSPRLYLNGATFHGASSFSKTGVGTDAGVGGNTFNGVTDLINSGSGELWLHVTSNDAFNNDIRVTSIGGAGIGFGSGSSTGIGTLAAGRTVAVGTGGFNAGNLTFNNFKQIGPTAQTLTLTGTGILKFSPGTVLDGDITTASPNLLLNGGTFNGSASFTKSGIGNDTGLGGNVYNGQTDLIVTGAGELRLYQTLPDAFNHNLRVACVNGGGIRLGLVGNAGTGTLAAGRTVTVGPSGFNAGVLYFTNFNQPGGTPQSIAATGTSQLYFTTGTTFNGPITAVSPRLFLNGATFQNTAQFTKSGTGTDGCAGGNVFNGTTDLIVTGNGMLDVNSTGSDAFNADLRVSSNTTGGVRFGQLGGNASLASGRSLSVGALGFSNGTLSFRNFSQLGVLPNSLLCTGSSSLQFQPGSTFNAALVTTSGALLFNGSTFQANSRFTKTGATTENSNGGNTFNGLTELIVLGNGQMNLENTTNDAFNGNVQVVCTGTGGIAFGVGTGIATLANGRTMVVGPTGFASGTLNLRNFVQLGGTAQNILLTGTALLQIRTGTIFNGPLTTVSPGLLLDGGTFNNTVDMTKNGTANNSSVGGNTFNGTARLVGAGTGSFLLNNVASDVFNGTAQLVRTGAGAMQVAYTLNATFNSNISMVGSTGGIIFGQNNGSVYIAGAGDRNLDGVAAFPPYIRNFYVNTSGGGKLFMNVTTDVWNRLGFDSGVIMTSALTSSSNGILRLANGILFPTPANATSYVDGFVQKIGNSAFNFPVGNGGVFAPIGMSAPAVATHHFTAKYVRSNPNPMYNTLSKDIMIDHLSECEYWILDRTNSTTNVSVTLTWDTPRSCGVTNLSELTVARWNGTQWNNQGNGGTTGTTATGSIVSAGTVNLFATPSPFTLASTDMGNPLPIELVSFEAEVVGVEVLTSWTTASESNNDRFEVQRSTDAMSFSLIGTVEGAGNSQSLLHYGFMDTQPLSGTSYYRLRQVDLDGTATYSSVVAVDRKLEAMVDRLRIFPNPAVDVANIHVADLEGRVLIRVSDMAGRVVHESTVPASGASAIVPVVELRSGVYSVYVRDEAGFERKGRLTKE